MLVLRQTFQYNPWRLLQIGNHLQVEVTRLQDSPVNGSQLDYDLLVNAQGPALVAKQQATVLNLGGKEKELSASEQISAQAFGQESSRFSCTALL